MKQQRLPTTINTLTKLSLLCSLCFSIVLLKNEFQKDNDCQPLCKRSRFETPDVTDQGFGMRKDLDIEATVKLGRHESRWTYTRGYLQLEEQNKQRERRESPSIPETCLEAEADPTVSSSSLLTECNSTTHGKDCETCNTLLRFDTTVKKRGSHRQDGFLQSNRTNRKSNRMEIRERKQGVV